MTPAPRRRRWRWLALYVLAVVGGLAVTCAGVVSLMLALYQNTDMPLAWGLGLLALTAAALVIAAWRSGRVPRP